MQEKFVRGIVRCIFFAVSKVTIKFLDKISCSQTSRGSKTEVYFLVLLERSLKSFLLLLHCFVC
jgi:hypothetical protein